MIRLFFISVLFITASGYAQNRFFNVLAGGTHYSGDLGNAGIPKIIYPAGGIGFGVELNNRMLINANLFYGKMGGHDKFNPKTKERNLSFYSHIAEFSLQFEYNLFDLYEYKLTPHFFTGVGLFNYSPYTKVGDNIVYLSALNMRGRAFLKVEKNIKLHSYLYPLVVVLHGLLVITNAYLFLAAYAKLLPIIWMMLVPLM